MRIYQNEKGHDTVYIFDNDFNKMTLTGSFLTADTNIHKYKTGIENINRIIITTGSGFLRGYLIGSLAGFIIGLIFWGNFTLSPPGEGSRMFHLDAGIIGGVITSVPFGLVGGLFGLLIPAIVDYILF